MQLTDDRTEELSGDVDAEFVVTFNADSVEMTHTGGDAIPANELLTAGDVDEPRRWGEYDSVSVGDFVTIDASGSNRTIIVVHSGPYGGEEVFLRTEK